MQSRTIACGLTTLNQPEQNLLANIPTTVTSEMLLSYEPAVNTQPRFERSHNPHTPEIECYDQIQPELETMLLSNFANYQNVIEQKLISATENLSSNRYHHQVPNLEKAVPSTYYNSEYLETNFLNNWKGQISQFEKMTCQALQGQLQTVIQSKLNQDLTKKILHDQISRVQEKIVFQECISEPTEAMNPFLTNRLGDYKETLVISQVVNEMPTQTNHICFSIEQESKKEQKMIEEIYEQQLEPQQYQMAIEPEQTQYSLNSDNLIGIIQDTITNNQAQTQFKFKNQIDNEFDFSQYAQIRLEEVENETKQCFNQELQQNLNFQPSLISGNYQSFEDNKNLSLQVNVNSDSKLNTTIERKQLATNLREVQDVFEDFQKENNNSSLEVNFNSDSKHNTTIQRKQINEYQETMQNFHENFQKENNFSQDNHFQNEYREISEFAILGVNISLEKNPKERSIVEEKQIFMEMTQDQNCQFIFRDHNQPQNQLEKNVQINTTANEQKNNLQIINFPEKFYETAFEDNDVGQIKTPIIQLAQTLTIHQTENINLELHEQKYLQIEQENNGVIQENSQIPIQIIVQPFRITQQITNVFEQKNQVFQTQNQTEMASEIQDRDSREVRENNVSMIQQEINQMFLENKGENLNLCQIYSQNKEFLNGIQEAGQGYSQVGFQQQNQAAPIKKSTKKSSSKYLSSKQKDKRIEKTPKNDEKPQLPFINICNSLDQNQRQETIKTEHIQIIPHNFNNFSNLQPCISININRENQISLNLFRTYPINQNNYQPINQGLSWERKIQSNLPQKFNSNTDNNSIEAQGTSKYKQLQKKQLSEIAIQTIIEEDSTCSIATNTNMTLQNSKQHNQDTQITQIQQESMAQKLNKIRKIADHYMLCGSIQQAIHKNFEEALKTHVLIRFSPQPLDDLGKEIFKDGLVMVALVKMIARSSKTPFLQNYIYEYLQSVFTIQFNNYLFNQESKKAKENYQNYLIENYEKNIRSQQKKEEQPIKRTTLTIYPTNIQRKLTHQSNNIAFNEKCCVQTRRKQNNQGFYSTVQKRDIVEKTQQDKNLNLKESLSNNDKKELNNDKFTNEKVPIKPLQQVPKSRDCSLNMLSEKSEKEKEKLLDKEKTQKKIQKVAAVMQQESPSNSIQQIDDNNFKKSLESPTEHRLTQNHNEDKSSKIQKGNRSKYSDLKMNSFQKNECAKQVEACLQNRSIKFNQLYQKYKKIRETKKNDQFIPPPVPAEDKAVSITKSVLVDSKEKDLGVEKKKSKHVQFIEEPMELKKDKEDAAEGQEEAVKVKKRKKTKKIESMSMQEQEQTSKIKKSKR